MTDIYNEYLYAIKRIYKICVMEKAQQKLQSPRVTMDFKRKVNAVTLLRQAESRVFTRIINRAILSRRPCN